MAWYRNGTLSLVNGSDMVTGVGTAWVGKVMPGGILFVDGQTSAFEVKKVISDTSLQLATVYTGASAPNKGYGAAPTQGYLPELAQQVTDLLTAFGEMKTEWLAGEFDASSKFDKTGGEVTNNVGIRSANPGLALIKALESGSSQIVGYAGAAVRWLIALGDNLGNSDLRVSRYSDAGAYVDSPLVINRATGLTTLTSQAITSPSASLSLNKTTDGGNSVIDGKSNNVLRWRMQLGDVNGHFALTRYNDAGNFVGTPLYINRTAALIATDCDVSLGKASPTLTFQKTAEDQNIAVNAYSGSSLRWQINMAAATSGDWQLNRYNDAGTYLGVSIGVVRATGQIYLYKNVTLADGNLTVVGNTQVSGTLNANGVISSGQGYQGRAGSGGVTSNTMNTHWSSGAQQWVDSTYIGTIQMTSDERIKHAIVPMAFATADFLKFVPIKFRYQDIGIFADDGVDKWGFSAQNVAAVLPAAVEGDFEALTPDGDPQPALVLDRPILAVTVLEVQKLIREIADLKTRIAALEAA